jgi:hypothetical protein
MPWGVEGEWQDVCVCCIRYRKGEMVCKNIKRVRVIVLGEWNENMVIVCHEVYAAP